MGGQEDIFASFSNRSTVFKERIFSLGLRSSIDASGSKNSATVAFIARDWDSADYTAAILLLNLHDADFALYFRSCPARGGALLQAEPEEHDTHLRHAAVLPRP